MNPTTRQRMHPGLVALAFGGFGIGLTEFVIAGLLTNVATDLGVSIPTAGHLVSGYALAVVAGALVVTATLLRRPPKSALLVLMVLFILGNALSAWAPTYPVMLAGRIVAALCHGGFFGIGSVLAADLVAPEKKAGAIAIMFGGLTTANVLGVPFGTFIGQTYGWRTTFMVISGIGIAALIGIVFLVPAQAAEAAQHSLIRQMRALARPQVLLSMLVTILVFGGMFGAFIYIEPLLTNVTGYSSAAIPWLLVLFGIGLFLGNVLGGHAADRNLDRTLLTLAVALPLVLTMLALMAHDRIGVAIALTLTGLVGFATVPGLQLRVLRHAHGAPTMASAANIAAFNLGNAIGVYLGGLAIAAHLGYTSPVWVGVSVSATGLAVAVIAVRHTNRHRPHATAISVGDPVTAS